MNETHVSPAPTRIGGFRILQKIEGGAGSQGSVVKAVCEENWRGVIKKGTIVALKIMHASDDDGSLWAKLESRTNELSALRHENVVRYYGCFRFQNDIDLLHVIVQEYLEGETLKARLQRHKTGLDADEGLMVAKQAVTGLAYTSGKGIVHRDVKPGNIFLCLDARRRVVGVKLIDFEISRRRGGTVTTASGLLRGTFDYMAPEFTDLGFRGDVQSDIFSMGVVVHEIFSGRIPYEKLDGDERNAFYAFMERWRPAKEEGKSPLRISNRINSIVAHANDVLRTSMSFDRAGRFLDFEQFRKGLDAIEFRNLNSQRHSYRILQWIGEGGFGVVFKGIDKKTGHLVAIKRLVERRHAERFSREARIVERLRDPCFVSFVEYFERDVGGTQSAYLVMDFLDGMPGNSLKDAIRRRGDRQARYRDILRAFMRYARGLKALHDAGIVHRDIKPANLYYPEGHPERSAIMDLGVALDVHGTITSGKYVPGTPDYMPPEVVISPVNSGEKSRGDAGMDIFALGLSLYEVLSGKPAYPRIKSDDYDALFERAKSLRPPIFDDKRVVENRALLRLLKDMTEPDCTRRLQDAGEVYVRLKDIAGKLGVDGSKDNDKPVVAPSASYSTSIFRKALFSVSLVVFLVAVGAFVSGILTDGGSGGNQSGGEQAETNNVSGPLPRSGSGSDGNPSGGDKQAATNDVPIPPPTPAPNPDPKYQKLMQQLENGNNLKDSIKPLLEKTPVGNRLTRLDEAKAKVDEAKPDLLDKIYDELANKIAELRLLTVGCISNACPFDVTVQGLRISPGTAKEFEFKINEFPSELSAKADSSKYEEYNLRSSLDGELDGGGFEGKTIVLEESNFTYRKVSYTIPPRTDISISVGEEKSARAPGTVYAVLPEETVTYICRKQDCKPISMEFTGKGEDFGKGKQLPLPAEGNWEKSEAVVAVEDAEVALDKLVQAGRDIGEADEEDVRELLDKAQRQIDEDAKTVSDALKGRKNSVQKRLEDLVKKREDLKAQKAQREKEARDLAKSGRITVKQTGRLVDGLELFRQAKDKGYVLTGTDRDIIRKSLLSPFAVESLAKDFFRMYTCERKNKRLSSTNIDTVFGRKNAITSKLVGNESLVEENLSNEFEEAFTNALRKESAEVHNWYKAQRENEARDLAESGQTTVKQTGRLVEGLELFLQAKDKGYVLTDQDKKAIEDVLLKVARNHAGDLSSAYRWSVGHGKPKSVTLENVMKRKGEIAPILKKLDKDIFDKFEAEFLRELKAKSEDTYEWFMKESGDGNRIKQK